MSDPRASKKRKRDTSVDASAARKGLELPPKASSSKNPSNQQQQEDSEPAFSRRKLVPPRPFPTVSRSDSATGPRSAHKEGKNLICLTRKTPLGAYMRRCKDLLIKDGYKTLQLSAMGAAIPHLLRLVAALPPILPFAADEFHQTITTGTVSVQDELIPDDEEEDIAYETRHKSSLFIVITIGDGKPDAASGTSRKKQAAPTTRNGGNFRGGKRNSKPSKSSGQFVFQEPEQQ